MLGYREMGGNLSPPVLGYSRWPQAPAGPVGGLGAPVRSGKPDPTDPHPGTHQMAYRGRWRSPESHVAHWRAPRRVPAARPLPLRLRTLLPRRRLQGHARSHGARLPPRAIAPPPLLHRRAHREPHLSLRQRHRSGGGLRRPRRPRDHAGYCHSRCDDHRPRPDRRPADHHHPGADPGRRVPDLQVCVERQAKVAAGALLPLRPGGASTGQLLRHLGPSSRSSKRANPHAVWSTDPPPSGMPRSQRTTSP